MGYERRYVVAVRLDRDEKRALQDLANRERLAMSQALRRLIVREAEKVGAWPCGVEDVHVRTIKSSG